MPANKKKKAISNGYSDTLEPVAKRTRTAEKKVTVSESSEGIIDILNEDCWRAVLDYVDLSDLVRSECVSKQWQHIVYRYIQGVRLCLRVKPPRSMVVPYTVPVTRQWHVPVVKCRNLNVRREHHIRVVEKYARAIVAADCVDGHIMTALGKHCPDLEDLRVVDPQHLRLSRRERFNKLRRGSFHNVIMFRDCHISKFLSSTLEELTIMHNLNATGLFLNNMSTDLKCLSLSHCYALKVSHLLSAPLTELTRLELHGNLPAIIKNVSKFIEKTPKLEYLGLEDYQEDYIGGLADAICRLSGLKHLNLNANQNVDDSFLEAVGCCKELRTVNIGNCKSVTSAGVLALCRGAGKTLTALNVSGNDHVTEDDITLCISLCPKLEFLDLRYSESVSSRLAPAAARAAGARGGRARRLRLALTMTPDWLDRGLFCLHGEYLARVEERTESYDNLILVDSENLNWQDYL